MSVEAPGGHVIAIQMLRAIAAIMVVFVHFDTELARLHYATLNSGWMSTGVDIFFVISGFIMWTSLERRPEMSPGQFLRNRLIRIVPLYWLITGFVVLVALFAPATLHTTELRPWHAVASFLFIPARHPAVGTFWPLVVPGWSLNYEMLFYGLLALALAITGAKRLRRFLLLTVLLTAVFWTGDRLQNSVDVMHFYANPILFEFLIGVVLAIIWSSGRLPQSFAFLPVVVAGFACLWAGTHSRLGLPLVFAGAACIVGGAVFLPRLRENAVSRLGDASYSLYLTHTVVLAAMAWTCANLDLRPGRVIFILVGLTCTVATAFLVYTFFELPMSAALKKVWISRTHPHPRLPEEASWSPNGSGGELPRTVIANAQPISGPNDS